MDILQKPAICLALIIAFFSAAWAQEPAPSVLPAQTHATPHLDDSENDPAEGVNRVIFAANRLFDDYILKPVSHAYQAYVPEPVAVGVQNVSSNFREPRVLVNDVLQGNMQRASNTAQRFAINSTVGAAGLFDVATTWNLPHHDADFGTTLGVWGVPAGPHVQLPLLAHSNVRDVVGKVVDSFADPLSYMSGDAVDVVSYVKSGSSAAHMIGERAKVRPRSDALERSSDDYYATLRHMSAQRRAQAIEDAKAGHVFKREERATVSSGSEVTVGPVEIIGPPAPESSPRDFQQLR